MKIKGKWYTETEVQAYIDELQGKIQERDKFLHCIRAYFGESIGWVDLYEEEYQKLTGGEKNGRSS